MTNYILKQSAEGTQRHRMCVVSAVDSHHAVDRAEEVYGGDWHICNTHRTLEELQEQVEVNGIQAVLLNI